MPGTATGANALISVGLDRRRTSRLEITKDSLNDDFRLGPSLGGHQAAPVTHHRTTKVDGLLQ
jgi:hypothetical protein